MPLCYSVNTRRGNIRVNQDYLPRSKASVAASSFVQAFAFVVINVGFCFNGLLVSSILLTIVRALDALERQLNSNRSTPSVISAIINKQTPSDSMLANAVSPASQTAGHQPLYAKLENLTIDLSRTYGLNLAIQLVVHGTFVVSMTCYATDISKLSILGPRIYLSRVITLLSHLMMAFRVFASAEQLTNKVFAILNIYYILNI